MNATALDATNSVVIDPSDPASPPMLIFADGMAGGGFESLRAAYLDAVAKRVPLLLCGDRVKVFQLVDGRWRRLG
jgi:hypothetical protein